MHISPVTLIQSTGSRLLLKQQGFELAYFTGTIHFRLSLVAPAYAHSSFFLAFLTVKTAGDGSGVCACRTGSFAQMALLQEDIVRSRCGGKPERLHVLDVRFVSPLLLPTECMGVHVDDTSSSVYVTDATGQVTMLGTFEADVCAQQSRL